MIDISKEKIDRQNEQFYKQLEELVNIKSGTICLSEDTKVHK